MSKSLALLASFAFGFPFLAYAATPSSFKELVGLFISIIGLLIPLVATLCLLVFFWGTAKFILAAGDENKIKEGRWFLLWGVIGLFVMVSLWGIVALFTGTLDIRFGLPVLPE